MTVAAIWRQNNYLWCAADSRLVAGKQDQVVTEKVAKIHSIPIAIHAQDMDGCLRTPHYWTQYGFVYAGSAAPASMTAITASTLLQQLARQGSQTSPPRFEEIAEFVRKVAQQFMTERRQLGGDAKFWSALFGWCPHASDWKVAHISPQGSESDFRVELDFPPAPITDGAPWLVLGTGQKVFEETYAKLTANGSPPSLQIPNKVIEKMIEENLDETVGGTISVGAAHENGFVLFHSDGVNPWDTSEPLRLFNGLDLDRDLGDVFPYKVETQPIP